MRILVAVDQNPYSMNVVRQVAELAWNTWANVTLLCVGEHAPLDTRNTDDLLAMGGDVPDLVSMLSTYRGAFLNCFDKTDPPYGSSSIEHRLVREKKGVLRLDFPGHTGRKDLDLRIRFGRPSKEIVSESNEIQADLIVVGCHPGAGCKWENDADVPEKIVKNADCSVFVVKEDQKPQMIVCCLDHDTVSQPSIELINQLVTLYNSELEIIGVTGENGLGADVDRRMTRILGYYTSRNIKAWVKLVDSASLKAFINQAAEKNLVALWTSKQSFLDKIFSRQHLGDLAKTAESSVLILR